MTGRGVSDYDMPIRSWLHRTDVSGIQDAVLSSLLDEGTPPQDAPGSFRHLADVLAALRARPATDEMAGLVAATAEFRRRVGVSSQPRRFRPRRIIVLASLLSAKAATATALAVISLGGLATVAYSGNLPAPAQRFAHDTIGAPGASADPSSPAAGHSGTPVGPNASGSAAFGLCTAYTHATEHGTAAQKAVAFRNLENAAGGAANVASYCAGVPQPGPSESSAGHPAGMPSGVPSGQPAGEPSTIPSPHPTGPPSHP